LPDRVQSEERIRLHDRVGPLNALVAFPYFNDELQRVCAERANDVRLLLDSGAFTSWRLGKPVTLDDYCRFLESATFPIWRYFLLDVIGDPVATRKNLDVMLKRGFNPIPVFTRGEDPAYLDELYKVSDVVAIGGLVKTKGNAGFVKAIMKRVGDRKVHWLGFTRAEFIKHYRPYTCDSGSWHWGSRFGLLWLYIGNGMVKGYQRKDMHTRPGAEFFRAIRRLGYDPHALANEDAWRGDSLVKRVSAASGVLWSRETEQCLGTKLFLAAGPGLLQDLLAEFDRMPAC